MRKFTKNNQLNNGVEIYAIWSNCWHLERSVRTCSWKGKQEVAKGFVTALVDHGVSEIAINELFGIDTYLDTAIEYVTEDEDDGDTNYDEDVEDAIWDDED